MGGAGRARPRLPGGVRARGGARARRGQGARRERRRRLPVALLEQAAVAGQVVRLEGLQAGGTPQRGRAADAPPLLAHALHCAQRRDGQALQHLQQQVVAELRLDQTEQVCLRAGLDEAF